MKKEGGNKILKIDIQHAGHERQLLSIIIARNKWIEVQDKPDVIWNKTKKQSKNSGITNKINGIANLMQKCKTTLCLRYFQLFYPEEYNFYPKSFNLPDEYEQFIKQQVETQYIVKPSLGGEGKGIFLLKNMNEFIIKMNITQKDYVVQEYIQNPMLINNKKFDLRFYVLITKLNPFQCYLNKEGLVRVCSDNYDISINAKKYAFLTNYSINQFNSGFKPCNEDFLTNLDSNKLSFSVLRTLLDVMGFDNRKIFSKIENLIASFMKSLYPFILYNQKQDKLKGFSIIGLDIILDDQGNPYFLEGNSSPSLNIKQKIDNSIKISPLDEYVKSLVVEDAIKIVFRKDEYLGSYMDLSDKYQLQSNKIVDLWKVFQFCRQSIKNDQQDPQRITCTQFCKISLFPNMVNKLVGKCEYSVVFYTALKQREQNLMNFYEFIEAFNILAKKFEVHILELVQTLMYNF